MSESQLEEWAAEISSINVPRAATESDTWDKLKMLKEMCVTLPRFFFWMRQVCVGLDVYHIAAIALKVESCTVVAI